MDKVTVEITEAIIKDRRKEFTEVDVNTDGTENTKDIALEIPHEEDTAESDDDGSLNLENILEKVETFEQT